MKLSQIDSIEFSLGRLQAMIETEMNESRRRVLEHVFEDFSCLVLELYGKESIENDYREDTKYNVLSDEKDNGADMRGEKDE